MCSIFKTFPNFQVINTKCYSKDVKKWSKMLEKMAPLSWIAHCKISQVCHQFTFSWVKKVCLSQRTRLKSNLKLKVLHKCFLSSWTIWEVGVFTFNTRKRKEILQLESTLNWLWNTMLWLSWFLKREIGSRSGRRRGQNPQCHNCFVLSDWFFGNCTEHLFVH